MAAENVRTVAALRLCVLSFLLAVCFALAWPEAPRAGVFGFAERKPAAQGTLFDAEIPPGEYVAFRWDGRGFAPAHTPELDLTARAQQALTHTPKWLRPSLASKLDGLEPDLQDALADTIIGAKDTRYKDEIAFCVAHLPDRELTREQFNPIIIAENARLIYEADARLDYAELIDRGDYAKGDWTTTVRYRLRGAEGVEEYYELPCEIYYWYIVYPKLGREHVAYVDPTTGEVEPPERGGVFWREYLMHGDAQLKRCASTHFIMEYPNLIERLPASAERAELALTEFSIDPIALAVDSARTPILCTFSWPGGQFDGQVTATTIPVELDSGFGETDLRENLLRSGSSLALLDPAIVPDGFDSIRIAILKDRDPFGEPTIERELKRLGFEFSVFSSDRIAEMLAAEAGFIKVVIPSGQPRQLYERLAESEELWREWMSDKELSYNRSVEFHGATDPAHPGDNWTGLRMPWGFGCTARQGGALSIGGYPRLLDLLSGAQFVWDNRPLTLSGDAGISPGACVLELLGYYTTQNLIDRCAEVPFYYRGPDGDACFDGNAAEYVQTLRKHYPQRSLYLHYGNCGEVGDILTAACRTALIPVRDVVAHPVDHVWNSVYLMGKWRVYTVFRSDGGTRFDDGVYTEKNHIGPMACRSDGYVSNTIGDYFGSTFVLEVQVADANGNPVDGATVAAMMDWVHEEPPPKIHAGLAWTDDEGIARIELGVGRDTFVQVFTTLEDWPELVPDTSDRAGRDTEPRSDPVLERRRQMKPQPALAAAADDIKAGETVHYDVSLGFALPKPLVAVDPPTPGPKGGGPGVALAVNGRILHGYSSYFGCNFTQRQRGGTIDLFVVDRANYELFTRGEPFVAAHSLEDADSATLRLPTSSDEWFVIVSNVHRMAWGQMVNLAAASA